MISKTIPDLTPKAVPSIIDPLNPAPAPRDRIGPTINFKPNNISPSNIYEPPKNKLEVKNSPNNIICPFSCLYAVVFLLSILRYLKLNNPIRF